MTRVDESEQGRFFLLTQKLDFDLKMGKLFRETRSQKTTEFLSIGAEIYLKNFFATFRSLAIEWKSWAQSLMKIYR